MKGNILASGTAGVFALGGLLMLAASNQQTQAVPARIQLKPTISVGDTLPVGPLRREFKLGNEAFWIIAMPKCESCAADIVSSESLTPYVSSRKAIGLVEGDPGGYGSDVRSSLRGIASLEDFEGVMSANDFVVAPFALGISSKGTVDSIVLIRRSTK